MEQREETMESREKVCTVTAEIAGTSHSLGDFPMFLSDGGYFFDYYALAEELVTRGLIEDEGEAARVCDYIERQYNEDARTEGTYLSADGTVVVRFRIEPATA